MLTLLKLLKRKRVVLWLVILWTTALCASVRFRQAVPSFSKKLPPGLSALLQPVVAKLESLTFTNNESLRQGATSDGWGQDSFDLAVITRLTSNDRPKHLQFAIAGGSISVGRKLKFPEKETYFNVVKERLKPILEPLGFTLTTAEAAYGGTSSLFYAGCIHKIFDLKQIDFLFLEFTNNDIFSGGSIEELVRCIWRRNPVIHIVYFQLPFPKHIFQVDPTALLNNGSYSKGTVEPTEANKMRPHFLQVARHYKIGFVTLDNFFINLGYERKMPYEERFDAANGYSSAGSDYHPSAVIHEFMGEAFLGYFAKSLESLASRLRISEADVLRSLEPIKLSQLRRATEEPPLLSSNWMDEADCFITIRLPPPSRDELVSALAVPESSPVAMFDDDRDTLVIEDIKPLEGNQIKMWFNFKSGFLQNVPCSRGFVPRLGIFNRRRPHISRFLPTNFSALATFHLSDSTTISANYSLGTHLHNQAKMQFLSSKPFFSLYPALTYNSQNQKFPLMTADGEDSHVDLFCFHRPNNPPSAIASMSLYFEQTMPDKFYPIAVKAVVIGYDCCP